MERLLRTIFWGSLLGGMLWIRSSGVHAQHTERVLVTVIEASNAKTDFDVDNDEYRDQLFKLFSYTGYSQLDKTVADLERSKRQLVKLPNDYELLLTLQGEEADRVLVQAVIRKGNSQFVDTILAILRPGVVFLGGTPSEDGTIIIVLEI